MTREKRTPILYDSTYTFPGVLWVLNRGRPHGLSLLFGRVECEWLDIGWQRRWQSSQIVQGGIGIEIDPGEGWRWWRPSGVTKCGQGNDLHLGRLGNLFVFFFFILLDDHGLHGERAVDRRGQAKVFAQEPMHGHGVEQRGLGPGHVVQAERHFSITTTIFIVLLRSGHHLIAHALRVGPFAAQRRGCQSRRGAPMR